MRKNYGIIYKITNKMNGKIYIGKTKRYYGNDSNRSRGIKDRLKKHIGDALGKRDYCRLLCKAIRKYGKENFIIEQITQCKLELTSQLETAFISFYKSRDKKIGYNIVAGGGSSECDVSEETRKKISNKLNGDLGVHKIFRKGKHVGYRAQRKQKGVHYYKTFANTKFTLEENYKKAKAWTEEIKNGRIDDKKYDKKSKLPTNITHKRKGGEIKGYRVNVRINGILHSKDFISDKYTMDEKLEQAKKFKESILK